MIKGGEYAHIKAIFFDNDGLLVDTEPLYLQSVKETFAPLGVDVSREWYIRENLGKGRSTFDLLSEKNLSDEETKELRRQRSQRYSALLAESVRPIDGVPETLEKLYRNFHMGVVTSSKKSHFEIIMEKTGLGHFFNFFITGDDVKHTKPDPEPYLKALALSGYKKDECLVLEDSCRGVEAAKAAGLTCFAIPDELTRSHSFASADKVLKNMRELPALLGI